jgi:hypothetical protein
MEGKYMITVDRALTLYTDQITKGNNAETTVFIQQLNPEDVDEFLESAEAVRVLHAFQRSIKFDDFFARLNEYKEEIENLPTAADFRGKGGTEAEKQVDDIFREEFGDE